ncbi:MAG: glutamate racemase [Candidatus Cryptobacteroides sp.]
MIGIFDSGVGGLSVFREIYKRLPDESYIYFSDNAHCPYGEKTKEYIIERAKAITEKLVSEGADVIVVACNTATSAAIAILRQLYSGPDSELVREMSEGRLDNIQFIGMEPAVKPAALASKTKIIGVLATAGTLKGSNYLNIKDAYSDNVTILEHVGQGFVELVENGDLDSPHAYEIVRQSVEPLLDKGADSIVLGCTHYPFLFATINKVCEEYMAAGRHSLLPTDSKINIIDPAPAVARRLVDVMRSEGLISPESASAAPLENPDYSAAGIRLFASGENISLLRTYKIL